jgi:hypothetical protein
VELVFQIALEDVFQTCGDSLCIPSTRQTIPAAASTEAIQKERNRPLPGSLRDKKRARNRAGFLAELKCSQGALIVFINCIPVAKGGLTLLKRRKPSKKLGKQQKPADLA